MGTNKKSWSEMSPDEKADFVREENRQLYDLIISETRRLAEMVNQQNKRITELKNEVEGLKKTPDRNLLLG